MQLILVNKMTFYAVCSIRKYQSNVTETSQVGIEGYRTLRRSLRHSKLDKHAEQTRYNILQVSIADYRQANQAVQTIGNIEGCCNSCNTYKIRSTQQTKQLCVEDHRQGKEGQKAKMTRNIDRLQKMQSFRDIQQGKGRLQVD